MECRRVEVLDRLSNLQQAGIDVGVKYEIYQLINRLAQEGIGIIIISSDLPELLGVSDRVAVMCEGRLAGILPRAEATQERVMLMASGETTLEESHG